MSSGPIKALRDSWKPLRVSTTDAARICLIATPGRGYCGRRMGALVDRWSDVTCADCRAAARADGLVVA